MSAPRPPSESKPAKRPPVFAIVLFLVVFAAFLLWRSNRNTPSEDALLATKPSMITSSAPRSSNGGWRLPPGKKLTHSPNDTPEDVAEKRLLRARHTLEGYKLYARYPPQSRPLSEMPDLQKPHTVQPSTHPMAAKGGGVTKKAIVTLSQDRLYLVGDETAKMNISCKTTEGSGRCEVLSAMAISAFTDEKPATIGPVPANFSNDDQGGAVGSFTPAKEGFSGYHGGIGVNVQLRIGSEEGTASFQLIYTPSVPARFTGQIREAMENGSLCLYVQMDVSKAGRYVLAGRVDDADGDGFAYLEFNDLLETGVKEARMCIFGLLVIDQRAKTPFTLRDLEGFVLFEDRDPDRELMSVLEGKVYTTKTYEESAFSSAEWQSEEKTRHLDEFGRDIDRAGQEGGEP